MCERARRTFGWPSATWNCFRRFAKRIGTAECERSLVRDRVAAWTAESVSGLVSHEAPIAGLDTDRVLRRVNRDGVVGALRFDHQLLQLPHALCRRVELSDDLPFRRRARPSDVGGEQQFWIFIAIETFLVIGIAYCAYSLTLNPKATTQVKALAGLIGIGAGGGIEIHSTNLEGMEPNRTTIGLGLPSIRGASYLHS